MPNPIRILRSCYKKLWHVVIARPPWGQAEGPVQDLYQLAFTDRATVKAEHVAYISTTNSYITAFRKRTTLKNYFSVSWILSNKIEIFFLIQIGNLRKLSYHVIFDVIITNSGIIVVSFREESTTGSECSTVEEPAWNSTIALL